MKLINLKPYRQLIRENLLFFYQLFCISDILGYADTSANVYSAACAIIVLHILLALFILKAFRDSQPKSGKQD